MSNDSGMKLLELLAALSNKGTIELGENLNMTVLRKGPAEDEEDGNGRIEKKLRAAGYDDDQICQLGAVIKTLQAFNEIQDFCVTIAHMSEHHDVLVAAELASSISNFMLRCSEELRRAEEIAGEPCKACHYSTKDHENLRRNAEMSAEILAKCRAKHELLKATT